MLLHRPNQLSVSQRDASEGQHNRTVHTGDFCTIHHRPIFGSLKQQLGGGRFHITEQAEIAVREWLWIQEPDLYRDKNSDLVAKQDKWIRVLADYF